MTIEGVARGLGRAVVRHRCLESKLRELFGDRINEARLKMAEMPEGAELVFEGKLNFPACKVDNIYILPGIPELFRDEVPRASRTVSRVDPVLPSRRIYRGDRDRDRGVPESRRWRRFRICCWGRIRSWDEPSTAVRITLESKDRGYVERALQHLLSLLPPGAVLRAE